MAKKKNKILYNYYEIEAKLLSFISRVDITDINQTILLRTELLSYIFSIDFLKEYYIKRVNAVTELLDAQKDTITNYELMYDSFIKLGKARLEDNLPSLYYFPLVCLDEDKIVISNSLRNYYNNFVDMRKYSFLISGVEYYVLSKVLIVYLPENKFTTGYLTATIIGVIKGLVTYIEYRYSTQNYNYIKEINKPYFLRELKNAKLPDGAKKMLVSLVINPRQTINNLADNCCYDTSSIRRMAKVISLIAKTEGEISGVRDAINIYNLKIEDLEKIGFTK